MATIEDRRRVARLVHRFGFGPKPNEFKALLSKSYSSIADQILNPSGVDTFENSQADPQVSDIGKRPTPNSPGIVDYANEKRRQINSLIFWWLDRMVMSDNPLRERMTWFWHGHWATSYQKVDDALPMYRQNQTLRNFALGNFADLSRAMVNDGALILWLDGQTNTVKAPNENLSRELMELFILGVNKYTEEDVKQTAKALTGYKVDKSSGDVSFNSKRHYTGSINVLGASGAFDASSLSDFLVSREDCTSFIAERIWYRFVSSTLPIADRSIADSFKGRNIEALIQTIGRHESFKNPAYSLVKSPVEWFVSACRALQVKPSQLPNPSSARNYLNLMGQVPFFPPSVGGWPTDQAWLSTSSAQYRISLASLLAKRGSLDPITNVPARSRVSMLADWLGIAEWSSRTAMALSGAARDPERMTVLGLCSPEYVVNA